MIVRKAMALSPGTRLGSYKVTALIGQGGMGEVWRNRVIKTIRAFATVGRETMHINLKAVAVVGAVVTALALLGVMIFGLVIF